MPAAAPDFGFVFRRPFAEQVAFFRGKLGNLVPTATWRDLMRSEHDRAFMVAGAAKADLLADLAAAVDKAISEGESLDAFRRRFGQIVQKHGWHGWTGEETKAGTNWRTRVIYRTNLSTSYAAGRLAQLQHFPLWVYRHSGAEHPRLQHKAWDGMTLPADHEFWKTHYPPCGWRCRCRAVPMRAKDYEARDDLQRTPPQEPEVAWTNPRTGEAVTVPARIDPGFGYNVGEAAARWRGLIEAVSGRIAQWPPEIGAALWDSLDDVARGKVAALFAGFVDEVAADLHRPRGRMALAGVMGRGWIDALDAQGVKPATAEIMLRDHDLAHLLRDAKAHKLPIEWLRALPSHLDSPRAVLLDRTHTDPSLLLVFDAPGAKLVLRLDYRLKKPRGALANVIGTGAVLAENELAALRGQIGKKNGFDVIEGSL